jgi:hypothetical protein
MQGYFERLMARWQEIGTSPKVPLEEGVTSTAVVRVDEDEGMLEWEPTVIADRTELSLPSGVHDSVREYLSSYWFFSLGGRFGEYLVELEAVPEPSAIDEYNALLADYRAAHADGECFAPIGFETSSGRMIVIERDSGQVFLEEPGVERSRIASSLDEVISGLAV